MIPLEFLKIDIGYHILCRLHVKDKEFRMLVDTGASTTMFDIKKHSDETKEKMKIKALSTAPAKLDPWLNNVSMGRVII